MLSKRSLFTVLLLLSVTVATVAEDGFFQRGCRRGKRPVPSRTHRAADVSQRMGGDFYHGDRRQLVILVSFSDLQFADSDPVTVWSRIFNEPNFSEAPFNGSIHDYFLAQSNGVFSLSFDFLSVSFKHSRVKYASTEKDDENSQYLVNDVVDSLLKRNIDWSPYDWNGDGYVNQIIIIYPGYGMNDGGDEYTIWPHQYWLTWHHKDRQDDVYCEPRQVSSGDKTYLINCYCALQEYANGIIYGSFGTICHEYSHCFGFPDFYGPSSDTPRKWELMDYGNFNGNGLCPPNYSALERWLMGWGTPTELTATTTVTSMNTSQSYLIRNDGHADEYYIVENRQQTGWDKGLPSSGLVVFHVDYDEEVWVNDFPNTDSKRCYHIIPANNNPAFNNQSGWAYPYHRNDSLTNNSKPAATLNNANTDGSKFMSKSLRDIKVENGLASFRFTVDTPTGIHELEDSQTGKILFDLGPIYIIRYKDGTVKKVMKR